MSRNVARFYGGFLWTTAASFGAVALTWWFDSGTGRENAILWMNGIVNTTTIATLWTIGAVCAVVGAIACRRHTPARHTVVLVAGTVVIAAPLLIGGYFLGSTFVWLGDNVSWLPPLTRAEDDGYRRGYVTTILYWWASAVATWALITYSRLRAPLAAIRDAEDPVV